MNWLPGSLLLLGVAAGGRAFAQNEGANAVGAYEILICKGPCSFAENSNVVVRGVLVLMPGRFAAEEIAELRKHKFEILDSTEGPEACFALHRVVEDGTYAGITPNGITSWSVSGSKIKVQLYSSPDAGYEATARVSEQGLYGSGVSWGVGAAETPAGPDVVVSRRIGAAFATACTEALRVKE